jgi:hypothetical protein
VGARMPPDSLHLVNEKTGDEGPRRALARFVT